MGHNNICGCALNSGTPAAEPEISLGAPLAEAKSTHRKTRRNSRDFGTGSAANANQAQMAEVDPVVQMAQKKVPATHLPSHCETLASLGLRLVRIWIFVFMASHKQVFCRREKTISERLEFAMPSAPRNRSSQRAKRTLFD